jgi:hypothetical protein
MSAPTFGCPLLTGHHQRRGKQRRGQRGSVSRCPVTVSADEGTDDVNALISYVGQAGSITPNQTPRATILQ